MSGAFRRALAVEDQNTSVLRSCSYQIFLRRVRIVGTDGTHQRAFTHISQLNGFVEIAVRHQGTNWSESLNFVRGGIGEWVIVA